MKILYLIAAIFFILLSGAVKSQFTEKKQLSYRDGIYDVFIVKVDSLLCQNLSFLQNSNLLPEPALFDSLETPGGPAFFAITASIVDSVCQPLGLYLSAGSGMQTLNTADGKGNFYLKPNGVFSVHSSGVIAVQDAGIFKQDTGHILAIQSGPMLITNNVIHKGFDPASKNKNIRTGVGVFQQAKDTYLVFARSSVPVRFYQFAELFKEKFKCSNALNLESGANCSIHLPSSQLQYNPQVSVCRYLFIRFKF